MNIIKNLVVPAIGLSFLLGGAAAFAQGDWGDDNGDNGDNSADQGTTYLVGEQGNDNNGTETQSDNSMTYLVGAETDGDTWGDVDQDANVQLVGDHDEDSSDTTNNGDSWLV